MNATHQISMPELIVHDPMHKARQGHIGENVYADRWRELMATPPDDYYSIWSDDDGPEETARLRTIILRHMWGEIGQREATVAASFIVWLGANCGRCMLDQARTARKKGIEHPTLYAWTIENKRSMGINSGIRTIEYLLAPPATVRQVAFTSPESPLTELPELSLRDTEVIDNVRMWLDTVEGQQFVDRCERDIKRISDQRRAIERQKLDPVRQIAESTADQMTRNGTPCHVRRNHNGDHGWFVVRDDDYSRVWPK